MIHPYDATIILLVFIVVCGFILPVLNWKMKDAISYRWTIVVVVAALLIGAVIDFSELDSDSRHIVILGGLIITGAYVLLRTVEKMSANGWSIFGNRDVKAQIKKGDVTASLSLDTEAKHENKK